MPILPTTVSLLLFLGSFVLIAVGAESDSKEREAKYSTLGFGLLVITTIALGILVVSNALSNSQ